MKVKTLDKKWKEVLFAASGFGPNLMMILMGAYFTNSVSTAATDNPALEIIPGACLIVPVVFSFLWAFSKAFDGIIDIPFAKLTDSLNTKWGRRRPPILICFIPMLVSYIMCWIPIGSYFIYPEAPECIQAQTINTIWIVVFALIFFSTYTMCLIAFYGSFSTVCDGEKQRLRVSSYKAIFDTITYAIVYALVPLLVDAFHTSIDKFAIVASVVMLTMLIPLFMIKEGEKYGYPEREGLEEEHVTVLQSLKVTFGNKVFSSWLVVNCTAFFGLQMFLSSMSALIGGSMGFKEGWQVAIIQTCAFGPVPMMLYLFNKLKAKKGVRFTYQTCLIAFAIAILSFDFASLYVVGENNVALQFVISIVGSLIGSWGIGAFFMMPLMVPAQVSSIEERLTKQNHSAMYFAAQAVTTSIIGAVASGLVWETIKMVFISKAGGIKWADTVDQAAEALGVQKDQVFNLGALLVPVIVSIMCIVGFICAFRMPRDFSPELVAKELKRYNPDLDISQVTTEESDKGRDKEITFVNIAYWVLSGSIFGFIWSVFQMKEIKQRASKALVCNNTVLTWLLCAFVPFFAGFMLLNIRAEMEKEAKEKGIKLTNSWLYIVFSVLFPILPLNVVSLALLQKDLNRMIDA